METVASEGSVEVAERRQPEYGSVPRTLGSSLQPYESIT